VEGDLMKTTPDWDKVMNLEKRGETIGGMEKSAFLQPHVEESDQVCVYLGALEKWGPFGMHHVSFRFYDYWWSHGFHFLH
jgi:hypothetical protein